jgi:hypothetical protein
MIRRRCRAGQLAAKKVWFEDFTTQQKRPLEGFPRRLPLLQPIRLFRILN